MSPAAGKTVSAIDPAAVLVWDGGLQIDASTQASLQLDDAPDNPSLATSFFTSLWANDLVGFRADRWISWYVTDSKAVQYSTRA